MCTSVNASEVSGSEKRRMRRIPTSISDVSAEWLRDTLLQSWKEEEVEVVRLEPVKNRHGVLSTNFKAEVRIGTGEEEERRKKLLFGKVLPDRYEKALHVDFVKKMRLDVTEVEAYRAVFRDLIKYEESLFAGSSALSKAVPGFVSGGYELNPDPDRRGFFLLLEDVSDQFEVRDYENGLTPPEVCLALGKLGRFSGLAYCMGAEEGVTDFNQKYGHLNR